MKQYSMLALICQLIAACSSSIDVNDEDGGTSQPMTPMETCLAWESSTKPGNADDLCREEYGHDFMCPYTTYQNWYDSCAGDCKEDMECVCECMLHATPWDAALSDNCVMGYDLVYECLSSHL